MLNVAFVVHGGRLEAVEAAARAQRWLEDAGHQVRYRDEEAPHRPSSPSPPPGEPAPGAPDLAVSFGGDGTMLRTVAMALDSGTPVLGVNLGQLGYLTEVEPAGLVDALGRFIRGDYGIEERMTLTVEVVGATRGSFLALNEAVVEKTVPGHTVRLAAAVAGRPFVTYAADGLLVATPTGSTAYNLSVRGPIVSPRLRALVVSPISPHMLFDRTLVLEPDEAFGIEVLPPRPAVLVVDGVAVGTLEPGDTVQCREGPAAARLVTFGPRDFHAVLRTRFHLADR